MRARRWLFGASSLFLLLFLQGSVAGSKILTVASAPPVVIRTMPAAGLFEVDPDLDFLQVEFSKDMLTEQMWSIIKVSGASFPELAGGASFLDDKRTFVLPVSLEPETTYAMWFNSRDNDAFQDVSGNSAVPYFLIFRTGR